MRIYNTSVLGIEDSVMRSRYPMHVELDAPETEPNALKRAKRLSAAPSGSGHDCFLKGIIVQADFEMPQYWWQQAKRYHWFDFISSQSTMHRIGKMNIDSQSNGHVDPRILAVAQEYVDMYNKKLCSIQTVLSNIPQGLLLTAGITTNYLQLKTMYAQRKDHRLPEWSVCFREWVELLPYSAWIGAWK